MATSIPNISNTQISDIINMYKYFQGQDYNKEIAINHCRKILDKNILFNDFFTSTNGIDEFIANFDTLHYLGFQITYKPFEIYNVESANLTYVIKSQVTYKSSFINITTPQHTTVKYNSEGKIIYYEELLDFTKFNLFRSLIHLLIKIKARLF
jgi:hypothetical protein